MHIRTYQFIMPFHQIGAGRETIIQARKLLRQAVRTVEAGGSPSGLGTSYYELRAREAVLPVETDWRRQMMPEMQPEAILQTV